MSGNSLVESVKKSADFPHCLAVIPNPKTEVGTWSYQAHHPPICWHLAGAFEALIKITHSCYTVKININTRGQ